MARVTLTATANRHLAADPKLNAWKIEKTSRVPILGYYQRSYLTSNEGDVTEFGDGFMLTFDRADMDWQSQGLAAISIEVVDDCNILVVAPHVVFKSRFRIGWDTKKYTYEQDETNLTAD